MIMDVKAKKSLGQNFLIDENIINKIVNELNILDDSLVIEIGPGKGALTKLLVKKAKYVLAYELDKECINYLNLNIKNKNLKIINEDILKANIKEDILDYNDIKNIYIIGNLPYYITTPIILKLIEDKLKVNKYLFMVQEEVANRYCYLENNKEYNALTVYLNYLFKTKKCFVVKNTSFDPIPKVQSAIISLEDKEKENVINEDYFYEINKLIFRQKRKTLINNLKDKFNLNILKEVFNKLKFKENIRAEELSIKDIINLSDNLFIINNVFEYAYAKINLTLRVFKNKNDYHPLNSLMVPIDLHDTLIFVKSDDDKVISNIEIENNVILKTIKLFKEKYNINSGVHIYLKKEIPLSAGLAGGSSDSSATLRGLNRLFNLNKTKEELESLAKTIGSDNNFTLYNKAAIASNRGEILKFIPNIKEVELILIKPNFGLSTKEIYDNYQYIEHLDTTNKASECLINGDISNLENYLFNDLESASLLDEKYKIFKDKLNYLNIKSYQSGSGPTRFSFDLNSYDILKKETNYLVIKTKIINDR